MPPASARRGRPAGGDALLALRVAGGGGRGPAGARAEELVYLPRRALPARHARRLALVPARRVQRADLLGRPGDAGAHRGVLAGGARRVRRRPVHPGLCGGGEALRIHGARVARAAAGGGRALRGGHLRAGHGVQRHDPRRLPRRRLGADGQAARTRAGGAQRREPAHHPEVPPGGRVPGRGRPDSTCLEPVLDRLLWTPG